MFFILTKTLRTTYSVTMPHPNRLRCQSLQRKKLCLLRCQCGNNSHKHRIGAQACQHPNQRSKGCGVQQHIYYRMTCRLMEPTPSVIKTNRHQYRKSRGCGSPLNVNQIRARNLRMMAGRSRRPLRLKRAPLQALKAERPAEQGTRRVMRSNTPRLRKDVFRGQDIVLELAVRGNGLRLHGLDVEDPSDGVH